MDVVSPLLIAVVGLLVKISRDIGRMRGTFDRHVEETERRQASHRSRLRAHGRRLKSHDAQLARHATLIDRHESQLTAEG